ncbi:MAG: recombinase family protein [Coriobacteriia bacterium]|nr:recombinase family protein [Coriobacteriia bacterium]
MPDCVVYARVSTKEQQDEGYSIPAQLKAIRIFSESLGLSIVQEFIEAESAGAAGRTQFTKMCAFLSEHPAVRVVVAHKLDRLYRNFADQIALEEVIGARARYVVGDVPDTPQGELLRDVQLSVAKYYLGNLSEEVRKGMNEKVAQGGWPHKAPLGYLNDKGTRSIIVDPVRGPMITKAFERYATGLVSVTRLVEELNAAGLRTLRGNPVRSNTLNMLLRNPFYMGVLRYGGETFTGSQTPLVSPALFEKVQAAFKPNKINTRHKHVFLLRDFMFCDECGCKITAENHKGHAYYHCTNKKRVCKQRGFMREEPLVEQVSAILVRISIGPEVLAALVEDALALDRELDGELDSERTRLSRAISAANGKLSVLTEKLVSGVLDDDLYKENAAKLKSERQAFELALHALDSRPESTTSLVAQLAGAASVAHIRFDQGDIDSRREILAMVCSNLMVRDGNIVSYQWKSPFDVLEMDDEGALLNKWWSLGGSNP